MAGRPDHLLRLLRRLAARPEADPTPDADLLARFVAVRDEAAFAALVGRHGGMVLGVCRRVLGDPHRAEEAAQVTWLTLARNAAAVRRPGALAAWLHGTARRLALNARRGEARHLERERRAAREAPPPPDPLDELTARELLQILDEELGRLPEAYRLPLILCAFEGRTVEQAAAQLAWTPGSVRARLARGRERLRQRLLRRGLTLSAASLALGAVQGFAQSGAPMAFVRATVRAALAASTGGPEAPAAGVAAGLAGWLRERIGVMTIRKVMIGVALVLTAGLVAVGAGTPQASVPEQPEAKTERPDGAGAEEAARPAVPLPDGALFRLGETRWRHPGEIFGSALSPDGKLLATSGWRSVILWDVATGRPVRLFPCYHGLPFSTSGLTFSPDGRRLGYVRGSSFACVWDLPTGKEVGRREERDRWTSLCQFIPDGKELVLLIGKTLRSWNPDAGRDSGPVALEGVSLLSPDGKTYLIVDSGKAIILGDTATSRVTTRLPIEANSYGVAFAPDGKTLAVVHQNKEVQIRDLPAGNVRISFPLPSTVEQIVSGTTHYHYRVGFSGDGKLLLLGTWAGTVHRWDLAAGKELPPLEKHIGQTTGFHTLPDGRTLLSTGADGLIRRWDLTTGREYREPDVYQGRTCAALSRDGRLAAIADLSGRVDLWDAARGRRVRILRESGPIVNKLAFAPDSRSLAVGERSASVQLFEVPSGRERRSLPWEEKRGRDPYLYTLLFSPDGRRLCVSDYASQMRLWDLATGKVLWRGRYDCAAAYSPDGTTVAAAQGGPHLTLLDAATGQPRATVRVQETGEGLFNVVRAVTYAPDGRRLAVALMGGQVAIWDRQIDTELLRFQALDPWQVVFGIDPSSMKAVASLAFSPDGKWLATGGDDASVRVWEVVTGKEVLRRVGHESEVTTVAFGAGVRTLLSCGEDGQTFVWDLRPRPAPGTAPAPEKLWDDLGAAEAAAAYRAVWALADDAAAGRFLRSRIDPVAPPDKDRLTRLIADLDSDRFETRDVAFRALAELGERAGPALEAARKAASSAETKRRLGQLLDPLKGGKPSPADVRRMRAVQALELAGTEEARRVLHVWAGGVSGARLTEDARAALERLSGHPPTIP